MDNPENGNRTASLRVPWNKGKLIGQKPPLRSKQVWSIRTKLGCRNTTSRSNL